MSFKSVCDWNLDDGESGVYCTDGYVTRLVLDDLNLNGTIPQSLGLLTHMEYLSLGDNSLNGVLPESISLLVKLKYMDLRSNYLSGWLPDVFQDATSLETLKLRKSLSALTS